MEQHAFEQLADTLGMEILQGEIDKIVPSIVGDYDVAAIAKELNGLKDGKLYKYCKQPVQSCVNIVAGWLAALASHRCPSFVGVDADKFLSSQREKLSLLITHTVVIKGKAEQTVRGRIAITAVWTEIAKAVDAGQPPKSNLVRKINAFRWLMTPHQAKLHVSWTQTLYGKAGEPACAVPMCDAEPEKRARKTGKSAAGGASSSKDSAAEVDEVMESTLALFKKKAKTS